ncbi:MAG: hypothetical protein ABR543_06785 [Gemmatimonadaceae bacterium]
MTDIKFCGLTREEDAKFARQCGARYAGVIFAAGPRAITPESAARVLDAMDSVAGGRGRGRGRGRGGGSDSDGIGRVGVFDVVSARLLGSVARKVSLDIVQLHGDPDPAAVAAARAEAGLPVWAVVRISGAELPKGFSELAEAADAVVLDARVAGRLGGTGVALDWSALADTFRSVRRPERLVLAGGLTPTNVAAAIQALDPDVVDVSSGVESLPGIKDHVRMREFVHSVQSAG